MRINFDEAAKEARHNMPYWFEVLLNEKIQKFIKEYKIPSWEANLYFINRGSLDRLVELFKNDGIIIEKYSKDDLSSWGLIIPDDDESIVEYKLIYGDIKDADKSS